MKLTDQVSVANSLLTLNAVKAWTNCCSKSSTATESGKPQSASITNGWRRCGRFPMTILERFGVFKCVIF